MEPSESAFFREFSVGNSGILGALALGRRWVRPLIFRCQYRNRGALIRPAWDAFQERDPEYITLADASYFEQSGDRKSPFPQVHGQPRLAGQDFFHFSAPTSGL